MNLNHANILGNLFHGKVELLEQIEVPDGTRVLVTILPDDDTDFWLQASQSSIDTVWNNSEDDVYAQLL